MPETINEQIAVWIAAAIDGQADPDATFTLTAVRPKILDFDFPKMAHGDVVIELEKIKTVSKTTVESRTELGTWRLTGVIRELPANTAAGTVLSRMAGTIRTLMFAGQESGNPVTGGKACGGLANNIDCPETLLGPIPGGVVAEVTVTVEYKTALADPYAGPT